jgi:hypothetical protein
MIENSRYRTSGPWPARGAGLGRPHRIADDARPVINTAGWAGVAVAAAASFSGIGGMIS